MKKKMKKPFFVLKTKNELLLAEDNKQLVLTPKVKEQLNKQFKLNTLLAAKVTKNSPGIVVEVESVETTEKFLQVAF